MKAQWITNGEKKPFYARKAFRVKENLVKATAKVCGLGQFNFFVNGNRAANERIGGAWTDYNKIVEYSAYDITDLLHIGENAAGFEVGNGWYILDTTGYSFHFPRFVPLPPNPNPYRPFADALVLAFEIELEYEGNIIEEISSDESVSVCAHGVTAASVYGSEDIDGAALQVGFSRADFAEKGWTKARFARENEKPKGELIAQSEPRVSVVREYAAECIRFSEGVRVFDLKQNTAAVLTAEVRGNAGETVEFFFAEKLDSRGMPDQKAKGWDDITTRVRYTIAESGKWEKVEQTFSYFAARYIGVRSTSDVRAVKALAITSATEDAGDFVCDNEKYNAIFRMIRASVESNLVSVHTDCPTIERFAWQEENHLMARSIFFMKNEKTMWEKMLRDTRAAQHTADDSFNDGKGGRFFVGEGLIPSQAPCYMPNVLPVEGMGSFYDIIAWGSFIILGAKWHYLHYGDKKIIKDNYDAGKKYFAHLKTRVNSDGFINHGLGDWGNPTGEYARENTETAFFYADAMTLMEFAYILGKIDEAAVFEAEAEAIKRNYNAKLLKKDKNGAYFYAIFGDKSEKCTTSAQALPLFWGLVPIEAQTDVENAFRTAFRADGALIAGEVSLPYIIQTAKSLGLNAEIAKYITRDEHPSYYAFVRAGETTLGEYWEENPRSHNHDMLGSIAEWYFNGLAGVEAAEAGFKTVKITPFLPDDMQFFRATIDTPHGTIRVCASRDKTGAPLFDISVPQAITVV